MLLLVTTRERGAAVSTVKPEIMTLTRSEVGTAVD
jgi:hypothetical protein